MVDNIVGAGERDVADEYDYCLVLPLSEDGGLYGEGPRCISKLRSFGLELFIFMGFNRKEIFVLIRAPIELLRIYAESINFPMLLDPLEAQILCEIGDTDKNIRGFIIPHVPEVVSYEPFAHIFGRYSKSISEKLYFRKGSTDHPFVGALRLKLTKLLMESQPPEGSEILQIRKHLNSRHVIGFFPLHDTTQMIVLRRQWCNYTWVPWDLKEVLPLIKMYIGEKVALYFGFVGHYLLWLWIPASAGFVLQVAAWFTSDYSSWQCVLFSLLVALWAIVMLEFWKRKESKLAMEWGISNFEETEQDRPEFFGITIDSPIDGTSVLYFSERQRSLIFIQSSLLLLSLVVLVIGAVVSITLLRVNLKNAFSLTSAQTAVAVSAINSLEIQFLNRLSFSLAVMLNDRENHKTNTNYEDSLIIKLFAFQFINSYATLFYLAFLAEIVGDCVADECLTVLSLNVGIIFGSRLLVNIITVVFVPFLRHRIKYRNIMHKFRGRLVRPEREYLLVNYDTMKTSLNYYNGLAITFGYTTLFITALPIASMVALVIEIIQVKSNAWKLLTLYQRATPEGVQDIGIWQSLFVVISSVSVVTNAGCSVFTLTLFDSYTISSRLFLFMGFQWFCFSVQFFLMEAIPDVTFSVEVQIQRVAFICSKLLDKVSDDESHFLNNEEAIWSNGLGLQSSDRRDLSIREYPNRSEVCFNTGQPVMRRGGLVKQFHKLARTSSGNFGFNNNGENVDIDDNFFADI